MPNLRGKTWTTTTPATVGDAQYWEDHLISDTDAAKIGTAVQTVNNTAPDASGNVDVVALPAGGTTGQVLTKQSNTSGDADWEDPASSGHTIEDEDGNTMPYQTTLQFLNADVSNDSVNNATVVDCKGAKGDAATVSVGTTSTLPAGSSATVTNSGTSSAAVFNFGIPAGANGTNGTDGADGADGVSVTGVELLSTSGKVKTYRMSFSNGDHFDYQVTDGSDGTGAGDMLKTDYDSASAVYNAGGIPAYVTAAIGALDGSVSGTPGAGKTLTAFSETNGVVSATFSDISITKSQVSDFPTIPTVTDTYSGTSSDAMSGKAVKGALETLDVTVTGMGTGKTLASLTETDGKIAATFSDISITKTQISDLPPIPADLDDLTDVVITGTPAEGQALIVNSSGKFANANLPTGGHTMIAVANDISTIQALANGNDNYVINAYTAKRWSNVDGLTLYTTAAKDTDTIGDWEDNWTGAGASREGWLWHSALHDILADDTIEIEPIFDVGGGEVVSVYAYRIDDDVQLSGVDGGAIAIKLNAAITNPSGVKIGFKLSTNRTANVQLTPIPS